GSVRHAPGGSRRPLRIRPAGPTSSVDIAASGNVGIGTASPAAPFDIRNTAAVLMEFQRTAGAVSKVFGWQFDGAGMYVANVTDGNFPLAILNSGHLGVNTSTVPDFINVSNGASLTVGGVWTNASSRALKFNIADLS